LIKGGKTVDENLAKIVLAALVLLAGATVAIRFVVKRTKKSVTKTIQKDNIVGGDQAGRDINKKIERT
jgi:L-cystine uptake protein TcyP (sodium:dicarboxylate symporter family)